MAVLNIRDVDDALVAGLRHVARERGMSVKALVLQYLRAGLEDSEGGSGLGIDIPGELRRIAGMIEARDQETGKAQREGFRGIRSKGSPGPPHDLAYTPEE